MSVKELIPFVKYAEQHYGWWDFVDELYEGGKKQVPNTNHTGKKTVTFTYLIGKDENYLNQKREEYRAWKKQKMDSSKPSSDSKPKDEVKEEPPKESTPPQDLKNFKSFLGDIFEGYTDSNPAPIILKNKKSPEQIKEILSSYNIKDMNSLVNMAGIGALASKDIKSEISFESDHIVVEVFKDGPFKLVTRKIYKDHIYQSLIYLKNKAPQGLGTKMFVSQVHQAKKAGLKYLKCDANRNDKNGVFGYKIWPKFGYDGEIPKKYVEMFPPAILNKFEALGIKEPYKISHLYSLSDGEGVKWWEENGGSIDVSFDLSDNSESMKTLTKYLEKKVSQNKKKASRKSIRRDPFLRGLL
jgi:hypothetical protein